MARKRRRDVIDEQVSGAYHVWTRTARRAFLCGRDPATRRDYRHRKELIRRRIEQLAGIFAIDCLDHAVLDNHLHLILRNRPDVVAKWSDEEVARRWLRLNHSTLELRDRPTKEQVAEFVQDRERVAAARRSLSSISSFMKHLKCAAAVRFNEEDGCTGCFWQSRFGATRLRDEASLLACSLYVNLNPMRAGMARGVEDAEYTSAHQRWQDARAKDKRRSRSGYLAAVHVDGDGYDGAGLERRASNKGYLDLQHREYLQLLEAMARREEIAEAGGERVELPPSVKRLGIDAADWEHAVRVTSRRFGRELAILAAMRDEAKPRR